MQNTTIQWRQATQSFRKINTSHFIWKGCECEGSWRPNRTAIYLIPTLKAISIVSFSFSWCSTGSPGAQHFAECWFFLPHLVTKGSDLQKLTDFLSSPSYIIVPSPTQFLEWHVWSSPSGNNCHAVHRSFSSGASVYDCTMGFYHVPYCQPSPPTRFLPITAIGMCHFLPVDHFGTACLAGSKVNIQH